MSEYQARKARMLELQREKEEDLKRELAAKAAREKQLVKEAEELRKRQEAAAKEARRIELMRANEALNKKVEAAGKKELEYDPFAEDARPAPSAPSPKPSTKPTNTKPGPSSSSKQSVPGPSSSSSSKAHNPNITRNHAKTKAQSNSPPPLGRKERAAKAFAQSAKKSAGDSLFSIRSLVESRDSPIPGESGSAPINRTYSAGNLGSGSSYKASSVAVHGIGMSNGLKRDPNAARFIPGKGNRTTREQLNSQAKIDGLRKLCPDRATRDRRTIEEIQRDIKAKKGGHSGSVSPLPPPAPNSMKGKEKSPIRNKPTTASSSLPKPASRPPKRPPSSSSDSDSDSSTSSARPRKKFDPYSRRSRSPPIRLTEHSSHLDIRDEIQKLFRRPGAPVKQRYADEFSDSGSEDMEAGMSDVEEEERRTARIARREDELAEREEREHRLAKMRRKKEAEKKGKGK
uniref:Protein SPT2 n=1 Tax=Kwoniella bestiolae CBS 10118 TaxID=1296100 RepID=A0A1B9G2C7_9TREE|nr:hypothetical protein I302_04993 [Kwoniella bestiolae CBS 10118]OCF25182.1 hypothetical protein I302_04993 [Kwoniella bestiolae CBS 10118]